ncbi:MAG: UDP-N-acetylglucosamine 1-carboxyvinyltransferase, partial [candidate division WOR-3 bacterium]|nr:UDP-N-acetylglucosamine 1-carboxyvinyltransferase [candidate division WOR-3 bacterium]
MDRFIIKGGRKLKGKLNASGAKNASLPILAASLLTRGETVVRNCPDVADVRYMIKVLRYLGAEVSFRGNT